MRSLIVLDGHLGPRGYRWVRAFIGLYLAVHFVALVPYASELFSSAGMLPDARLSPLARAFPNVLAWIDHPTFVTAFVASGAVASLFVIAGVRDRVAAVYLWYVLACLFGRNPLIQNPSLPYVGVVLLAHAASPRGRLRSDVVTAVWWLMAIGYAYSGWTKLVAPSWLDGTAVRWILESPLARPSPLRDAIVELPDAVFAIATYGVLALELAFPLVSLSRRLRPLAWAAMLALHLGLIALIDFADLSLGMVVLHAFTFDPRWLAPITGSRARDR